MCHPKYATLVHWLFWIKGTYETAGSGSHSTLVFLPKINQEIIFPCEMHTPCIRAGDTLNSPEGTPEEIADKCYSIVSSHIFYPKVATLWKPKTAFICLYLFFFFFFTNWLFFCWCFYINCNYRCHFELILITVSLIWDMPQGLMTFLFAFVVVVNFSFVSGTLRMVGGKLLFPLMYWNSSVGSYFSQFVRIIPFTLMHLDFL